MQTAVSLSNIHAGNEMGKRAQIYLNDVRGKHELNGFRSFHTFNFGNYQDEHRKPFGNFYVLNDDTLGGGRLFQLKAEEPTQVLLLPVVGTLVCNNTIVHPGEIISLALAADADLTICNPYAKETDLVNFIQLWFSTPHTLGSSLPTVHSFSLDSQRDRILYPGTNPSIGIGKYKGRAKDIYTLKNTSAVYAFVIQGAFEIEDRLLHARDGLALEGFTQIEFEALSNDAILLLVEVSI
jgi:hypothetical protein